MTKIWKSKKIIWILFIASCYHRICFTAKSKQTKVKVKPQTQTEKTFNFAAREYPVWNLKKQPVCYLFLWILVSDLYQRLRVFRDFLLKILRTWNLYSVKVLSNDETYRNEIDCLRWCLKYMNDGRTSCSA